MENTLKFIVRVEKAQKPGKIYFSPQPPAPRMEAPACTEFDPH